MFHQKLKQYADLLIHVGIHLQKGQTLVISSPVECALLAHFCTESAYAAGCKEVIIDWEDSFVTRQKFLYADDSVLDSFPEWGRLLTEASMADGAARLELYVNDPHCMEGVRAERIAHYQKSKMTALKDSMNRMCLQAVPRCTASPAALPWAKTLFPDLSDEDAVHSLWDVVFQLLHIDGIHDPVPIWQNHFSRLQRQAERLNQFRFQTLHYKNQLGTDLTIQLPSQHTWETCASRSLSGISYISNLPSEEIFTVPRQDGVNGTVVSSLPLVYQGCMIKDFTLEFKNGIVQNASARTGEDKLLAMLTVDEGASRLGEVALVSNDSPIYQLGMPLYNPLYDENASCHFALGQGIFSCLTDDRQADQIVNRSAIHMDFMIGTPDLNITGITQSGKTIPIFIDGHFSPYVSDV